MSLWQIGEDSFDPTPKKLHSGETVYTVGNGYFCTRGTFEEGYPHAHPATLLYGVFDDIPIAKEELANAPDWTPLGLMINGERYRLNNGKILSYHRMLDIRRSILQRSVRWESPRGVRLLITSERFASLADEHVGAVRYSVTIDEVHTGEVFDVALWTNFNVAVGNYDVMHWETVDQGDERELVWLLSETKSSGVLLAQTMSFACNLEGYQREVVPSYIAPSIRFYGTLTPGQTLTVEKVVTMFTSRDTDGRDPLRTTLDHHHNLLGQPSDTATPQIFDLLFEPHEQQWAQFWQQADVIIEGDDQAQLGLRYNIYQLRINTSSHDDRYSVAAKGLTGFGYRGHVFHDTEIFMLPFFSYVFPDIARNLLLYRYHLLPEAREKATSNGFEGAQYPWESTLDGKEATPPSIIHPETGEVIPVLNGFIELHITASIALATYQYWYVSGDDAFMLDYGAEILLSTAQYWASRAEKNDEHNDYEITNVVGPDEWHEHVNNNTYTNYLAAWNIRKAIETLDWLNTTAPEKAQSLITQLELTSDKLEQFQDVAAHMRILQDPETKVFEQFEGFFKLKPLDTSRYHGRKDSYQAILGVDQVQEYRIIKQADVLQLLTVLDQEFDEETKRANWDYYYPITDHDYGSSLTPALHVILAAELGRPQEAYELFMKGDLVDLKNLRGNTPEGIHAACAGAVWQATVLGYAGLRVTEEGYTVNPHWPEGWTRIAFTFKLRGETISVDLHK